MHLACLKMTSKRLLDKNPGGVRATGTGNIVYGGNYCTKHSEHFSPKTSGVITRKKSPVTVNGSDTQGVDPGSLQEPSKENCPNGNQLASGREKHPTKKKVSTLILCGFMRSLKQVRLLLQCCAENRT